MTIRVSTGGVANRLSLLNNENYPRRLSIRQAARYVYERRASVQTQATASMKPTIKSIELSKESTYQIGKTTIIVNNTFRQDGSDIIKILSRLICADSEEF